MQGSVAPKFHLSRSTSPVHAARPPPYPAGRPRLLSRRQPTATSRSTVAGSAGHAPLSAPLWWTLTRKLSGFSMRRKKEQRLLYLSKKERQTAQERGVQQAAPRPITSCPFAPPRPAPLSAPLWWTPTRKLSGFSMRRQSQQLSKKEDTPTTTTPTTGWFLIFTSDFGFIFYVYLSRD
jgi:hypothetical protein